jgi:hypothetical protein
MTKVLSEEYLDPNTVVDTADKLVQEKREQDV